MVNDFTHTYWQLHQTDGRVENFHYCIDSARPEIMDNLKASLTSRRVGVTEIPKQEFEKKTPWFKVDLYDDELYAGHANGACVGYIEHYQV